MAAFNPYANPAPAQAQQPTPPPATPPASPEELEQRKSKWRQMFDTIDNDPNVRNALISFGAQMLQPIQANDSFGASLGRSVNNSIGYLQATRQAGAKTQQENENQRIDNEYKQAQTQKTQQEADVVKPKADAAVSLNQAQAGNLNQATEKSILLTPAELDKLRTESVQNLASANAVTKNADSAAQNAATNAFDSQWRKMVGMEGLEIEKDKYDLEVDKLAKNYEIEKAKIAANPGYTPSADIQMLDHYIRLNGGDVNKGTEQFVQVELANRRAGAITTADAGVNASTSQNLMASAGFPGQANAVANAIATAKAAGAKGNLTGQVNQDGSVSIFDDSGNLVGTVSEEQAAKPAAGNSTLQP